MYRTPPVWLFISWCTAYYASTHVNISSRLVAPKRLFSLRVQWTNLNILLNFYQSSTSLFDTLVVKKTMAVSKSGLYLFMINKNFATTEWNYSPLFSLSFLVSSLTSKNFFVAEDVTTVQKSSPNIYMHSSNCSNISTCIVLSFISMFILNNICLFYITTDSSPKCFFTLFMISDITSGFLCNNFLSSTYQAMVHCVPSITLFATHLL